MLMKLFFNGVAWVGTIVSIYCLFYFKIMPRIIRYYRKLTNKRREYDKEIIDIQKEPDDGNQGI